MNVLVVNAGSSSLKFTLMETESSRTLIEGLVERVGAAGSSMKAKAHDGRVDTRELPDNTDMRAALSEAVASIHLGPAAVIEDLSAIHAIGHRVVQGGEEYSASTVIDDSVKTTIARLADIAPLHNPANLAGIEAAEQILPGRTNVAVFDTAFHATMPPRARLYALPAEFARKHRLRRYGFHGTSHQYVSGRAAELLLAAGRPHARIVTAHIGNGASVCAVKDGRSVDTTMGFTPLEGVVMGTRSGSIDPGLILFMADQLGMSVDAIDHMLNKESGLLGLAGIGSGDLRDVLAARDEGNESAAAAFDVYSYRLALAVGQMAVALDGLDAIVFTAGAGENSPQLRDAVCSHLGALGVELDAGRNAGKGDRDIAANGSRCRVLVVSTHEDLVIAQQTATLVAG